MANHIIKFIEECKCTQPAIIYNEAIKQFDSNDVKFLMVTHFNFDIEDIEQVKYSQTEQRDYQQELREMLFKRYKCCVVSGCARKRCLETAHIKPVSECNSELEKMDINNVLLLWTDLHKYFDTFDWSIDEHNTIIVNKNCDDYEWLKQYEHKCISLNNESNKYIKWHYDTFMEKLKPQEKQICDYDFAKSEILLCEINNKLVEKLTYINILRKVIEISDRKKIIGIYTNIIDDIKNSDGYKYYDELKLSIRNLNSTESVKEIHHICDANKIKLRMDIKLASGDMVKIMK